MIGQAIKQHTNRSELDKAVALHHGIKHSDVIKSYLALLSISKNDFEAINTIKGDFYFMSAMDIHDIPCEATLRLDANIYIDCVHDLAEPWCCTVT